MNKGILLFFISLTFLTQTNNNHKALIINNVPFEFLTGNVKQIVRTVKSQFDGGTIKSNRTGTDTTYFDIEGNQTESHWGQEIKSNRVVKYKTIVGKKGERIESRLSLDKGQTIFLYDSKGYIVKSFFKDEKSSERYNAAYKYDNKGRMTEHDYFLSEKFGLQKVFFEYDSQNHLLESDLYSQSNELKDKSLFKYLSFDKNGNWTIMIKTSTDKYSVSVDTVTRKIIYY